MIDRFEEFTANITRAYKHIIKIKAWEMQRFGLKASHVMCLFFIGKHESGLTAGELVDLCREDKAGISKVLSELKKQQLICMDDENGAKKYRAKYLITEKGREICNEINHSIIKIVDQCGSGLSDQERVTFYKTLRLIVNNIENLSSQMETENDCI